jgi:hypothetical protein
MENSMNHTENDYFITPKSQLKNAQVVRRIRFTEQGYRTFKAIQQAYQTQLQREISDSVTLDLMLAQNPRQYITTLQKES